MREIEMPPMPEKKKKASVPKVKISGRRRGTWLNTEDAANFFVNITHKKKPCVSTIRNWMRTGRAGYNGERIRLRHTLKNGKLVTTKPHMIAFIEALLDEDLCINGSE
jgi:hypothetical protein